MSQYSAEPYLADMNRCLMVQLLLLLAEIHEKFAVVPAEKASNNIVFVCKTHYINCLMEELGMSKNGNRPFQYVVIGYKNTYFVRDHSDAS